MTRSLRLATLDTATVCADCSSPIDGYVATARDELLASSTDLCESCHAHYVRVAKREKQLADRELI